MSDLPQYYQKSVRIIIAIFLIYAGLVATHLGEFWPFSIYPMFSQAGEPWKRAIVRDVTDIQRDSLWEVTDHNSLVGEAVPLNELKINTNDIANFLSKTKEWNRGRVKGLRKLFSDELPSRKLLLLQARGALTEGDTVEVEFIPFIYLTQDTTILNNRLKIQ